jgi:hypothetical protein
LGGGHYVKTAGKWVEVGLGQKYQKRRAMHGLERRRFSICQFKVGTEGPAHCQRKMTRGGCYLAVGGAQPGCTHGGCCGTCCCCCHCSRVTAANALPLLLLLLYRSCMRMTRWQLCTSPGALSAVDAEYINAQVCNTAVVQYCTETSCLSAVACMFAALALLQVAHTQARVSLTQFPHLNSCCSTCCQ